MDAPGKELKQVFLIKWNASLFFFLLVSFIPLKFCTALHREFCCFVPVLGRHLTMELSEHKPPHTPTGSYQQTWPNCKLISLTETSPPAPTVTHLPPQEGISRPTPVFVQGMEGCSLQLRHGCSQNRRGVCAGATCDTGSCPGPGNILLFSCLPWWHLLALEKVPGSGGTHLPTTAEQGQESSAYPSKDPSTWGVQNILVAALSRQSKAKQTPQREAAQHLQHVLMDHCSDLLPHPTRAKTFRSSQTPNIHHNTWIIY